MVFVLEITSCRVGLDGSPVEWCLASCGNSQRARMCWNPLSTCVDTSALIIPIVLQSSFFPSRAEVPLRTMCMVEMVQSKSFIVSFLFVPNRDYYALVLRLGGHRDPIRAISGPH